MGDKVSNLIALNEDYKFSDVAKISWAISRYYTNKEIVNYNADVSSIIYPRHEYAEVKSVKHRNLDKIIKRVLENKDSIEAQYIPMVLYALANVNFTDKEFFDGAILSLIPYAHNLMTPEDMGYVIQAMAMSNLSEYNKFFEDTLPSIFQIILDSPEITKELSLGQILAGITQLNIETDKIKDFDYYIGNIMNLLPTQMKEDHVFMIAPTLWGLLGLGLYDKSLFDKALTIVDKYKNESLIKSDAILLNQVFVDLRSNGLIKRTDFTELQQICREQAMNYDVEIFKKRDKEIKLYKGRDIVESINNAHIDSNLPKPNFHVPHYDLGYTSFCEFNNTVIFLVDPMIKNNDNQLNGYNMIKLRQIAEE